MARRKPRPPSQNTTTSSSVNPSSQSPPLPPSLIRPPRALHPLLPHLSRRHIYLLHTDTFPQKHKRNLFLVPLLLNTTLALFLLWRAWTIAPTYGAYLSAAFGYGSSGVGGGGNATATDSENDDDAGYFALVKEVLRRTGTLAVDYVLFAWVGVWPVGFFLGVGVAGVGGAVGEEGDGGPGSPFLYRLFSTRGAFHDEEVVVRRSRRAWDGVLTAAPDDATTTSFRAGAGAVRSRSEGVMTPARILAADTGEDGRTAREKIAEATDEEYVCGRSGLAMVGRDWELDFDMMGLVEDLILAARTATSGEVQQQQEEEDSLTRSQLCRSFDRWCLVYHEYDEHAHEKNSSNDNDNNDDVDDEKDYDRTSNKTGPVSGWFAYAAGWPRQPEAGSKALQNRMKIQKMKDRLTQLGKESLFFRWVELVAAEAASPHENGETLTAKPKPKPKPKPVPRETGLLAAGEGEGGGEDGRMPTARQVSTLEKAKEMFESEGIDFEQFWTEIGGMDGMPGFS
ncbi:MAG: hypothetical protein M1837_006599 [Sclerophora amabilis]|nr:MAG: hypothetical protein M1837_006599 [Sclerophora amabilis]